MEERPNRERTWPSSYVVCSGAARLPKPARDADGAALVTVELLVDRASGTIQAAAPHGIPPLGAQMVDAVLQDVPLTGLDDALQRLEQRYRSRNARAVVSAIRNALETLTTDVGLTSVA